MLWKKTIGMMIAFVVLSAMAALSIGLKHNKIEPLLEIPKIDPDAIHKIVMKKGDQSFALVRLDDHWIIEPGGYTVDSNKAAQALNTVTTLAVRTMPSKQLTSHPLFKVDEESGLLVSVWSKDGSKPLLQFIIGNQSSDKKGDYMRVPGDDRVFITSGLVQPSLDHELNDWRSKLISKFDRDKAKQLTVKSQEDTFKFVKNDQGDWTFATRPANLPEDYKLDSSKVDHAVSSMANLYANGFYDPDAEASLDLGLNPPKVTATVELTEGAPVVLEIGAAKGNTYYAKRADSDQIYTIAQYHEERINVTPESVRDLHVTPFAVDQAKKLTINAKNQQLDFEHDGKGWVLKNVEPQPKENFNFDQTKVVQFVQNAADLEGTKLIGKTAPAGSGFDKPKSIVKITLDDGTVKTIKVGDENEDKQVYLMGNDGTIYTASRVVADRMVRGVHDFKITVGKQQTPFLSSDALKGLPPEVAQKLLQQQKQKIVQQQMLKQMQKQQQGK